MKTYESFNGESYYRAETEFIEPSVVFEPNGYYEMIGANNKPVFMFDEHQISDTPELCASKFIGGCVMGSYSMTHSKEYFIYEINEKPDKDISNWIGEDFDYLKEVRYRHKVTGNYIGKVMLTQYQQKLLEAFYAQFEIKDIDDDETLDEYHLKYDKLWDDIENDKLTKVLSSIKVSKNNHIKKHKLL